MWFILVQGKLWAMRTSEAKTLDILELKHWTTAPLARRWYGVLGEYTSTKKLS